jgi:RNA polymerase sigma-70 factor (ECF subfamily)
MVKDVKEHARFERLVGPYAADLYRFALWLCGHDALAKDLVQETLLRAWRALDRLNDEAAVKSWLITILRREYARTFERKVPPISSIENVVIEEDEELAPEQRTERKQLQQSILELAPRYREPLLLQVVMGYSCDEIAEQLGISKAAVMTQLFRAREQLKDTLQVDGITGNVHGLF